jgi:hypothetical protein
VTKVSLRWSMILSTTEKSVRKATTLIETIDYNITKTNTAHLYIVGYAETLG